MGERLGEFPRTTQSQLWEFTQTVTHLPRHTLHSLHQVHFYPPPPPGSNAGAFFLSFLVPADRFSSLQVQRNPLSLAKCKGGCSLFFFTTPPLSAHKCVGQPCSRLVRLFLCFLLKVLTVPFSLIPLPFVSRPPCLILSPSPSPRRSIAMHCPLSHCPHYVASVSSPLSHHPLRHALPLAMRLPFAMHLPFATCHPLPRVAPVTLPLATCHPCRVAPCHVLPLSHRPSPRIALVASPSPHVALVCPLATCLPFATRHPHCAACRPVWKMEGK